MKKHLATNHFFLAFSVLLLALTLNPPCIAQSQAPAQRQLISIQFLRIKPGMGPEWRQFRKNETLPMLQKASVKEQTLWGTAVFGEGGGFLIVSPIESLTQYDGPAPAVRALGQEGATAYQAKAARFIESSRTVAIETRPELSMPPKPGDQPNLVVVTTTTIAPGRDEEYETFVKTAVLPTMKKAAPKGYLVSRVAYGGNLSQYVTVVLLDSFADLQKFRDLFGKEATAARLAAKSAGIVTGRENAVYRFVPDLSIMPAPSKAENK